VQVSVARQPPLLLVSLPRQGGQTLRQGAVATAAVSLLVRLGGLGGGGGGVRVDPEVMVVLGQRLDRSN
jgi:hypothetical protein